MRVARKCSLLKEPPTEQPMNTGRSSFNAAASAAGTDRRKLPVKEYSRAHHFGPTGGSDLP